MTTDERIVVSVMWGRPSQIPGSGVVVDIDEKSLVLGVEFLSFEEHAELLACAGGALELPPERVENPADFHLEQVLHP